MLLGIVVLSVLVSVLRSDELPAEVRSLSGPQLLDYVAAHAAWRLDPDPIVPPDLSPTQALSLLGTLTEPVRYPPTGSNRDDLDPSEFPVEFDSKTAWPQCSPIIDRIEEQRGCGSCWAISTTTAMSDRLCIASEGQLQVQLSVVDLMACCYSCGTQCKGGYPRLALQHWQVAGLVSGANHSSGGGCRPYPCHLSEMGYCTPRPKFFKCERQCVSTDLKYLVDRYYGRGGVRVYGKYQTPQAQLDLITNGPLVAVFDVHEDFYYYKSGVYYPIAGKRYGRHAVRVVGYGVDEDGTPYWRVANSWGVGWGEDGYFKIRRGQNDCNFESEMMAADADVQRSLRGKPQ